VVDGQVVGGIGLSGANGEQERCAVLAAPGGAAATLWLAKDTRYWSPPDIKF